MSTLNLPNAKLIWDRYHLINHVWKYGFRRSYSKVKELLEKMIDSYSKEKYEEALSQCRVLLQDNPKELDYLNQSVHSNRHLFARCITIEYDGLMGKRGTSHSEQNHSSIVSLVGPQFSDNLVHQLQRMLNRQRHMAISRQREMAEYIMLLPSRLQNLKSKYPGQKDSLSNAAKSLSPWAFKLFLVELQKSREYRLNIKNGIRKVTFHPKPNSQVRVVSDRCNCLTRRTFLVQCRHEICCEGGRFDISLFDTRWKRDNDDTHTIERTGMFFITTNSPDLFPNMLLCFRFNDFLYRRCFGISP